jgi:hypothetical protein
LLPTGQQDNAYEAEKQETKAWHIITMSHDSEREVPTYRCPYWATTVVSPVGIKARTS